jgi:cell volume regulation protein A
MPEIADFGSLVLVTTGGFALAVLGTKFSERTGLPAPALFLAAAALLSDLWPAVYDAVPIKTVERIAVVALVVILFNGGVEIGWSRFRDSLRAIVILGIAGTFATAAALAAFVHLALGIDWTTAALIGAALAPTDPAVMFAVLGRREIAGRSSTVLQGEAGVNDPAGIALMIGMIELATHDHGSLSIVASEFALEMSIGLAAGVAGGFALAFILRRLRLPSEGMYPVLALMLAGTLYGATAVAHGSGFLAVFLAGLLLGGMRVPYKAEIERFHLALASFAELAVFVALGLTLRVDAIDPRDWVAGLALFVVLALVIRPLVVVALSIGTSLSRAERAFIAWCGLKGAVPILLAAFAVVSRVPDAERIYAIVFIVVFASVAVQGTLVPYVAHRLHIAIRVRGPLPWELSIRLGGEPPGAREFEVAGGSLSEGTPIRDLPLGEDAWITLVVRDDRTVQPDGSLVLEAGDRLLVLAERERSRSSSASSAASLSADYA